MNRISKEDEAIFRAFIKSKGTVSKQTLVEEIAPTEVLLKEWENQKSKYLFGLFEGNTILSKPIAYEKSEDILLDEIEELKSKYYVRLLNHFYDLFEYPLANALLSSNSLIDNIYHGPEFMLGDKRISKGHKLMKLYAKIVEEYDLDSIYFEEFRLEHSRILNDKIIKGDLCLSIHPLDYITMSDNNSNWKTCLSWLNPGSYRQGVIEAMNSASVVVGYIKGKENMIVNDYCWNNKKWRCLFIVNERYISSIKSYPYYLEEAEMDCMEWLTELVREKYGWTYETETYLNSEDGMEHCDIVNHKLYTFNFNTNKYMYSDFCNTTCMINLNLDKIEKKSKKKIDNNGYFKETYMLKENYLGASECMCCGELKPHFDSSREVFCSNCAPKEYCEICGNTMFHNFTNMTIKEYKVCPKCKEREREILATLNGDY